ncbi:MAG: hypothetical protein QXZ41_07785 [Ignisphaera sp.]
MDIQKILLKMLIYGSYIMFLAIIGLAIVILYPLIKQVNNTVKKLI